MYTNPYPGIHYWKQSNPLAKYQQLCGQNKTKNQHNNKKLDLAV